MPAPTIEDIARAADDRERAALRAALCLDSVAKLWTSKKSQPSFVMPGGRTVVLQKAPKLIKAKKGETVGIDALVKVFEGTKEIHVDPHRICVNPPLQVVTGRDRNGNRIVTFDPVAAYLAWLADSIRTAPNPKGWGTNGTVSTFYAGISDGYVESANVAYATARAGGTFIKDDGALVIKIGQQYQGGFLYYCWEGFISFDTSSIDDGDTVSDAVLELNGNTDSSTVDFTMGASVRDWGASLTTGDYVPGADLAALTLCFELSSASYSSGYMTCTSTGNMPANVNKTGTTYLILFSEEQRDNSAPSASAESFDIDSADNTGTTSDPKLTVTHAAGGAPVAAGRPLVGWGLVNGGLVNGGLVN